MTRIISHQDHRAQVFDRILFLDIDGVLNSRRYFRDTYDGSDPDGLTWEQSQIDPAAVAILNGVLDASGAVVVLSSTWRLLRPTFWIADMLEGRGFTGEIIGKTPDLTRPLIPHERGHEIQAWLDAQPEPPNTFAIVDDDADMAHLAHRLVRTSMDVGLTEADASRLIALLGAPR